MHVAARLMLVGRAFHRRWAAELKARSPSRRRVQTGHNSSKKAYYFDVEVWRLAAACRCMLVQYCSLTGNWLARISLIRYVQQQEASVNRLVHWLHVRVDADRKQDARLRSKLAVVVR